MKYSPYVLKVDLVLTCYRYSVGGSFIAYKH